jgi:hypothetical protein
MITNSIACLARSNSFISFYRKPFDIVFTVEHFTPLLGCPQQLLSVLNLTQVIEGDTEIRRSITRAHEFFIYHGATSAAFCFLTERTTTSTSLALISSPVLLSPFLSS